GRSMPEMIKMWVWLLLWAFAYMGGWLAPFMVQEVRKASVSANYSSLYFWETTRVVSRWIFYTVSALGVLLMLKMDPVLYILPRPYMPWMILGFLYGAGWLHLQSSRRPHRFRMLALIFAAYTLYVVATLLEETFPLLYTIVSDVLDSAQRLERDAQLIPDLLKLIHWSIDVSLSPWAAVVTVTASITAAIVREEIHVYYRWFQVRYRKDKGCEGEVIRSWGLIRGRSS
ncbi:MAG: hypothetical protein RBR24_08275, partial [Candidatus Carbobacillus sp.]|nr:hypothetical protein [Candidatus Carbobacillus sp.]